MDLFLVCLLHYLSRAAVNIKARSVTSGGRENWGGAGPGLGENCNLYNFAHVHIRRQTLNMMECGVHCEIWFCNNRGGREKESVRMSVNRESQGAICQELPALPEILMNSPPDQLQKWPLLAIFRTPMTIFSQFMTTTGCKLGTRFGSFSPTNRSGRICLS